jgi:ATP-binding cassette subfamily C (CFTR/MRP) protein 1
LARALYSRKDILILDDVFSGLDNTTSRTVFQRLLGPAGLLRLNRNTVILATSDVNFLPAADFITVIEAGRIAKNQVRFDSIDPLELGLLKDKSSESDSDRDDDKSAQPRKKVLRTVAPIVTEEELARQTGDTDCYVIYLRSWGWHWVATIVILSIIGSALDVMPSS